MSNEEPGTELTPLPDAASAASGLPEFLGVITDVAQWASATFPVTIVKNVTTAVSRLITTAADIPATWLEGRAREIKAVSDANVHLTDEASKQLAQSMRVPEDFAIAAANKHAQQILRKQVNVQKVVGHALEQLKLEVQQEAAARGAETTAPPVADINEDWLNAYEQEAANMSSETMQRHFGRILAGEIRKPASFSIKTVKLMAQLDNRVAAVFTTLCSLSVSLRIPGMDVIHGARVVSMGSAAGNSLLSYGLSFDNLNLLQEYGLIITDLNSFYDFRAAVKRAGVTGFPFTHQNKHWVFVPRNEPPPDTAFNLHGVALSASGGELLPIVDIFEYPGYLTAMKKFFESLGFVMEEVQAPIFVKA